MKKYILQFCIFVCMLFVITYAEATEVVVFSQPCTYCEKFKNYMDKNRIREKYPDVEFSILDIREDSNHKILAQYIQKYKMNSREVGLPLIFIGDNYIMGWSDDYGPKFEQYIKKSSQQERTIDTK